MKRLTVLLAGIAFACTAPALAQEVDLTSILRTQENVMVDSIELTIRGPLMFATPDFGGEQVLDTFQFGRQDRFPPPRPSSSQSMRTPASRR